MSQALRDQNRVTTLLGVSKIDGITPTLVAANPSTKALVVESEANTDGSQKTQIVNSTGDVVTVTNNKLDVNIDTSVLATQAKQDTGNVLLGGIAGLTPAAFDYISLSYTGSDLTGVVFKTGGSGGTTVSTLVLAYNTGNLISVTKS